MNYLVAEPRKLQASEYHMKPPVMPPIVVLILDLISGQLHFSFLGNQCRLYETSVQNVDINTF